MLKIITALTAAFILKTIPARATDAPGARFFADGVGACARRLAYADGDYEGDRTDALENLEAMREARSELERAVRLWWPAGPGPFLEVGPFTQPILPPSAPATTVYWDMDLSALIEIERWGAGNRNGRAHPIYIDFNSARADYLAAFRARNEHVLREVDPNRPYFRAVVISQVFNYVDFRAVLEMVSGMQDKNGFLFITNRVNHGDDAHFHARRPRRASEVDRALERLGYRVTRRIPALSDSREDAQTTWVARKLAP